MSHYKIFLLVGPSGVGKNVVLEGVLKKLPQLCRLPSFTTRPPRPPEKNGRDYIFVSLEKFKQLAENKQMLEREEVHPGIFYGTPINEVKKILGKNNIIKHIDILGAQSLKRAFPKNAVSIFIKPPGLGELKRRLKKREAIGKNEVKERLQRVALEMQKAHLADYQVINDKLPRCINEVVKIAKKEMWTRPDLNR